MTALVIYMLLSNCGSFINISTNLIYRVNHMVHSCTGVGRAPLFYYNTTNSPNLTAMGRKSPILLLDYKKHFTTDLSIVISSYNSALALRKALGMLLDNSQSNYEIIIILEGAIYESYEYIVKMLTYVNGSSCKRLRVVNQPSPVFETSSNNIGMMMSSPNVAYVLMQPDIFIYEHGWDTKILKLYLEDNNIFGISGRCAHNFDATNKVGKCGEDVSNPTYNLSTVFSQRETANRGPLFLDSQKSIMLGFLDEERFYMDDSDHDIFRRAYINNWKTGYVPVGMTSPTSISPKRRKNKVYMDNKYLSYQMEYKSYRIKSTYPVVVSAVDISHLQELLCLIDSVMAYTEIKVIVYILGDIPDKLLSLIYTFNTQVVLRKFNYTKYPDHFKISRFHEKGHYSWKPVIINETMYEFHDVLWLDAGTQISSQIAFMFLMNKARQYGGVYSPASSGVLSDWTHPSMIKYFHQVNISPLLKHANCNAAIISVSASGQHTKYIVDTWVKCALDINCIEPAGASRVNHRQDQSALGIILTDLIRKRILPDNVCNVDAYDTVFKTNGIIHRGCDQFNFLNPAWYWIKLFS